MRRHISDLRRPRGLRASVKGFRSTILGNLRWGATAGLIYSALLCAIALVAFAQRREGASDQMTPSISVVLAVYSISGLLGGLLLGLLRPLITNRVASTIAGFVVAIPAALAITFIMSGTVQLDEVLVLSLLGAVVGLALGSG